jgi:HK97 family phage prohead protease
MSDVERRIGISKLEVRSAETGPPRLVGYAAKFDSWSEDLGGFRERIKPGAFDRALAGEHDVRALINHDSNLILGRSRSGTLRLSSDEVGLRMELDLPDTQVARDLSTSIQRGDIDQMSFGFMVDRGGSLWDLDAEPVERTITEVSQLLDVSVVTFPAYPQTEVALRSLGEAKAAVPPTPEPAGIAVENIRLRRRER